MYNAFVMLAYYWEYCITIFGNYLVYVPSQLREDVTMQRRLSLHDVYNTRVAET